MFRWLSDVEPVPPSRFVQRLKRTGILPGLADLKVQLQVLLARPRPLDNGDFIGKVGKPLFAPQLLRWERWATPPQPKSRGGGRHVKAGQVRALRALAAGRCRTPPQHGRGGLGLAQRRPSY
jgi:hypothetical protein